MRVSYGEGIIYLQPKKLPSWDLQFTEHGFQPRAIVT
jgi:hypothetical protein